MCEDIHDERREVTLPDHVIEGVERRLPRTHFESVDAYVTAAMERLLEEVDDGDPAVSSRASATGTDDASAVGTDPDEGPSDEDGAVREQLESLGYL